MKKIGHILLLLLFWSCLKEEAVPVLADFEYKVLENDYSIPVSVIFFNRTEGADQYEWRFEGANLSRSIDRNPGIIKFNTKGTYTITLTATNIDGSEDTKALDIKIDNPVTIDFTVTNLINTFSPATYTIKNLSQGADTYTWIFEGGTPSSSTDQDPGEVVFKEPGEHIISLEISNGRETYIKSTSIKVAPYLITDFNYTIAFEDDDYQIPAKVNFKNTSISATDYTWNIEGADITTSKDKDIEVVFNTVGEQKITLTATNGKESNTTTQRITLYKNTNLREFKNVKLGINTAHKNNTVGSFFSISTREVYTKQQITPEISKTIDLVFYGLNSTYQRNQFVSPNKLSGTPFDDIRDPKTTVFINTQELCGCSTSLTDKQFDEMKDDTLLRNLTIDTDDNLYFDNSTTLRIILFKTQEGKKGAIKIKEFRKDGENSYILVDIKTQKEIR
ncbi:PKD domain-containing protein [Aquimarina algiphila]|uniref:PKD domain-containing protein n=1 Tax=Aquimarina algiphila TaxID=2047982 RepID=UPI002490FD2C|nr:PKD domain-containing protein [Aquimarina algiphila]